VKERVTSQIILLCVPQQAFRECRSENIVINLYISISPNKHLGNVPLGNILINLSISRLQGVGARGFLNLLLYRLKIYVLRLVFVL
jgi:hypothetical protein